MDTFIGIHFKKETSKRFQEFSRTHFKSHTEAMATMLDFFFYNEISPWERLGPTGRTLAARIKKSNNAIIAILKDIEKSQTKPTVAMLYSLFEQTETPKKPMFVEKNRVEKKEVRFRERNTSDQNKDEQWKK